MVHSCDQKLCREAFETEWQTCVHWSLGLQKYANCETVLAYKNISSVGSGPFVIFVQFPHCLTMKLSNLKHWQHHDRPTHQPTCSAGVWLRSKATKVDKVASFQDRRVTMLCSCWFYIVYYKIVSWCLQFCPFLFGPAKLVLVKNILCLKPPPKCLLFSWANSIQGIKGQLAMSRWPKRLGVVQVIVTISDFETWT